MSVILYVLLVSSGLLIQSRRDGIICWPRIRHSIKLRSCACGAHWWIKRWGLWRHLEASSFNDKLQDQWTIWMFEFRKVLVLSVNEQEKMGYYEGLSRSLWKRSKWQLSVSSSSYCARCALRGW